MNKFTANRQWLFLIGRLDLVLRSCRLPVAIDPVWTTGEYSSVFLEKEQFDVNAKSA